MNAVPGFKQLRVFVSSTFQDMLAERNVLVGKVFPMVADYCHRLGIEFVGVDLRWGITDEQSMRGETVDICMSEIDRSRPLFIGMIGERYGWVPDGSGISVTEQEILYGALDAPEDTRAFFYLRDKELTLTLCGKLEHDDRLDDLKRRIRASSYPVLDNYKGLDEFGQRVYSDLTGAADEMAARQQQTDPVEQERANRLFLAQRLGSNYIDRADDYARLGRAAQTDGLTIITGEPGSGKTSLLARWAFDHADGEAFTLFCYFAGNSADKGWERLCVQLIDELKSRLGIEYPQGDTKESLRRAVYIVLTMAARIRPVVLAIDQLDALKLDDSFGLSWLPHELPQGVRVLVTLNEGEALTRLRRREHDSLRVQLLSPGEIRRVTVGYLSNYSKAISAAQQQMLCDSEQARNPLFLITLLNEVRHIGRHEWLTRQLGKYLECENIAQLFELVLHRLDREHDNGSALPRRIIGLLENGRGGLTEGELVSLLGNIPQAKLSPLMLALEPFTAVNEGAVQIASERFRKAALAHYSYTDTERREVRGELISWFTQHPDTPRRNYVLPALLLEERRTDELYGLLSQEACFTEMWQRNKYETKEYWSALSYEGLTPSQGYGYAFSFPEKYEASFLLKLAEFFGETADAASAVGLLEHLISSRTDLTDAQRSEALGLLGNLNLRAGKYTVAEKYYRKKYALDYRSGDRYEQQRAMGNIGFIALTLNRYAQAKEAFEKSLSLAVSLNNSDCQQIALGNLGNIAYAAGDYDEAHKLYTKQLKISMDSGNSAGLINAHGALGILYMKRGDFDSAERSFLAQKGESQRIGAADGIANATGNLGSIAYRRGNVGLARRLAEEKLALCRRTRQYFGEQNALGNLCFYCDMLGETDKALAYARERVKLTQSLRAFRHYADALYRLSLLEQKTGCDTEARQHIMLAKTIAKQHGLTALINDINNDNGNKEEETT